MNALAQRDNGLRSVVRHFSDGIAKRSRCIDDNLCGYGKKLTGFGVFKLDAIDLAVRVFCERCDLCVVEDRSSVIVGRPDKIDKQLRVVELPVVIQNTTRQAVNFDRWKHFDGVGFREYSRSAKAVFAGEQIVY